MFKKIKRYMCDPYYSFGTLFSEKCPTLMPDEYYIRVLYKRVFGVDLDLDNPQTYNEKMQWLKLHDHNPLYTQLADKYRVKEYVTKILGEGYVFEMLGVYQTAEEIDFDKLPNRFVLKCNNDSGSLVICKDKNKGEIYRGKSDDKSKLSYSEVREILNKGLKRNFFWWAREWVYKDIKPCIIAEKFMEDPISERKDLFDYKFFCFDGEPKYVWVGTNYTPMYFDVYSTDWKNQHVEWGYENAPSDAPKPENFDEMLEIARKLSKGIPHVRVDLYNIAGRIYFGEFTFYTWAGIQDFKPKSFDRVMGDLVSLPAK